MRPALRSLHLFFFFLSFVAQFAVAAAPEKEKVIREKFLATLQFEQGEIQLPGNIATLKLPAQFRYLSPTETERLLVEGWGNPPGSKNLGMIVPTNLSPLAKEGWGVVVTFEKIGHVLDNAAEKIRYDDLLKDTQESLKEPNLNRKQLGYPQTTVVGWAELPRYDRANHTLHWAKEVRFGTSTGNMLNYNLRILGRNGVLVLNAVAEIGQIKQVKEGMQQVAEFTQFTSGNRYTDFNLNTDKIASHGIAALFTNGVASRMSKVALLLGFVLLFKNYLILGAIALSKLFAKSPKPKKA
jgi:uncharacterized membrane-anchored protein